MSENKPSNVFGLNIPILILIAIILYISWRTDFILFLTVLSIVSINIDKFGGPFNIFETKKDKVDYKKLIFIMIYISIVLLYYNKKGIVGSLGIGQEERRDKIMAWFPRVLIILAIVFSFLNNENETFLTFEYLLYHWVVFAMVFAFYYLTKANDYPYAKMYLTIMMIISVLFMIIKPLFDVMFGFKTWKYSNYKYFNKNISIESDQKKNNKNVLNNLMNYIIINIVLLGVYVALSYTLLSYGKYRY
tara:strand:+ start:186 stop:926 length:741 start_codon:yes stop_codon:yes gene_type:complete